MFLNRDRPTEVQARGFQDCAAGVLPGAVSSVVGSAEEEFNWAPTQGQTIASSRPCASVVYHHNAPSVA